jgi:hypothetical protein
MSPQHEAALRRHLPDPSAVRTGENALLPALIGWLIATGRLRSQTSLAYEVPWLGRRVDVALVTGRGVVTAFELKIGSLQRALEQAAYNRSTFHRSWVVTINKPRAEGLRWAVELGVGLLVVRDGAIAQVTTPALQQPHPVAVSRLREAILARALPLP